MGRINDAMRDAGKRSRNLVELAKREAGTGMAGAGGYGAGIESISRSSQQMAHHAEQLRHYMGYVYAIIRTIGNRIAGQPVRVAVRGLKRRDAKRLRPSKLHPSVWRSRVPASLKDRAEDAQLVERHAIHDAFDRPNPIMVRYTMMFVTVASLELTGKAYWWLRTVDGRPEIWPLPASWVEPIHTEEKLFAKWKVRPPGAGEPQFIEGCDMAYFYYPDPGNPMGASAPLQALARTVTSDEAIEEAQRRGFINGVNPGLALIVGRLPEVAGVQGDQRPVLTKEQRNVLINAVKAQYRGVMNMEEPLILDGLIQDAKKITTSPREMDFLNSMLATRSRMAQGWGVNPISMGEMSSNRAESAVADEHLVQNVINPRIEMFSEIMTRALAPRFSPGEDLLVYMEPAKTIDPDHELQADQAMYDRGALGKNEWRAKRGMPPLKNGDEAIIGGVPVPVELEDQPRPTLAAGKPDGRKRRPFAKDSLLATLGERGASLAWLRVQRREEDAMRRALAVHLAAMGHAILPKLEEAIRAGADPATAAALALPDGLWLDALKATAAPHLHSSLKSGAGLEWGLRIPAKDWKSPKPVPGGALRKLAETARSLLSLDYWAGILGTIRDALAGSIAKAREADKALETVARHAVQAVLGLTSAATRALGIARTETVGAVNGGQEAVRESLALHGSRGRKKWVCMGDSRVRPDHLAAHGQTVGPDEEFSIGGARCKYPGDPSLPAAQRCNCRCSTITVE